MTGILLVLGTGMALAAETPAGRHAGQVRTQIQQDRAPRAKGGKSGGKDPSGSKPAAATARTHPRGADLGALAEPELRKSLEEARRELKTRTDELAAQHRRWETLEDDLVSAREGIGKLEARLEEARRKAEGFRKAIHALEKEHNATHAAETALGKRVAEHEEELRRRAEIRKLRAEARELQKRADALQKRAESLKSR